MVGRYLTLPCLPGTYFPFRHHRHMMSACGGRVFFLCSLAHIESSHLLEREASYRKGPLRTRLDFPFLNSGADLSFHTIPFFLFISLCCAVLCLSGLGYIVSCFDFCSSVYSSNQDECLMGVIPFYSFLRDLPSLPPLPPILPYLGCCLT